MQWYKADLHIHTVLSPCGGLDMSPVNIIRQAVSKKIDIIAITDHNSTKHCKSAQEIGKKYGITVLAGAEINSREEIHCLTFFENIDKAERFQEYIDDCMTDLPNKPEIFGNQYIVDKYENIIGEENRLLFAALSAGIDEISAEVHKLNGVFIPAHINRRNNGLYNQLGFLPSDLLVDALEVLPVFDYRDFLSMHPETGRHSIIFNSDAHNLERIGVRTTEFFLEKPDFTSIKNALTNKNSIKVCET